MIRVTWDEHGNPSCIVRGTIGLGDSDHTILPPGIVPELAWRGPDGEIVEREECLIAAVRTVIHADGADMAIVTGLPDPCRLLVNGSGMDVAGGEIEVSAEVEGVTIVELAGRHRGNQVMIRAASAEALMDEVRRERDALLAASDWTQMPDAPLLPAQVIAWRDYRAALRDVPQDQPGCTIETVAFPPAPDTP